MANQKKVIFFETPSLFNRLLSSFYRNLGFQVEYLVASSAISEWEKHLDFKALISAHTHALNNVELFYKHICARAKGIKLIRNLFKSDLMHSACRRIIAEKLLYFYQAQLTLNARIKNYTFYKFYYMPSFSFAYFCKIARWQNASYVLNEEIEIPGFSHLINFSIGLFTKITRLFLLLFWPFLLIKNVKKISMDRQSSKSYDYAIRIYNAGYNFNATYRAIDFLLDGKDITKEKTLFCIETDIDNDFRDALRKKGYNFEDIPNILKEVSLCSLKEIYFKILLPTWFKLCIVSISEPSFLLNHYRSILGLHLRWRVFSDKYAIKHYIVYNDFTFSHILRNIILSQQGVKTWYFVHSGHMLDLFKYSHNKMDMKRVAFSYLFYDNLISWGEKLSNFFLSHCNSIKNVKNIGCLWSEHVRFAAEINDYSGELREVYEKYRQPGSNDKKIIGVFDTTFGVSYPLGYHDMKCFISGVLKLADERKDFIFVVKLKSPLKEIEKSSPEALHYYLEMKQGRNNVYFLENLEDASLVIALCDLTISACFTSTFNEAIGFRKKAIYFDATDSFRGYYYDQFPNLVAHGYGGLVKLVDHWLFHIKSEEFSDYIDKYVKDAIDPYADGRAIARFRQLLKS
ncbi:polysaccharide biosynthesis PFTS motif protein [Candidatus Omnitrophota bacterium]